MALPAWSPHDEPKPAPPPLLPVQALVNTLTIEDGIDLLADSDSARAWLTEVGLIRRGTRLGPSDLRLIRDVRESLRALLTHNNGGPTPDAADLRPLRKLTGARRPQLGVDASGRVDLNSPGGDLRDGLIRMLVAVRDAQADGTWERLKACGNPDCRWAFFDRSRNHQGTWCEMATCGNRLKNRQFRARQR